MEKKKIINDVLLIGGLSIAAITALLLVLVSRSKENLLAKVFVQNQLVETIDLSKKEDRTYDIKGINGDLVVRCKDGGIAIVKSNCPHQDCVHQGFVYTSNNPIICAYNAVYIEIDGMVIDDVVI